MLAALAALFPARAATTGAINELWRVNTSLPDTLQTHLVETSSELTSVGRLTYEIGFSTKEQINLGFLFDSITLSLSRINGEDSANIVTGDVFGLTIAPLSPNGLLAEGGITVHQVTPRITLLADATTTFAYMVEVSLPASLQGADLRNSFSFFNNGDSVPSSAYAVVIPEPRTSVFIVLGGIVFLLLRAKRRERV